MMMRTDRGAITAEFAVVLPAVVLMLGIALSALQFGIEQLRLQGAAFDAARLVGRGEDGAAAAVARVNPDALLAIRREGVLVCADVSAPARLGALALLGLTASACVLEDVPP